MKTTPLSYTMAGMMRRVFGHVDGRISGPPANWGAIISKGTRDWAAAEELARIGVAVVVMRDNGFLYCRKAANEAGRIELQPGEVEFVVNSGGEVYASERSK
jgi:hypothetical protein